MFPQSYYEESERVGRLDIRIDGIVKMSKLKDKYS